MSFFQVIKFDFYKFVEILNSISPDYLWLIFLLISFLAVLFFLRLFGEVGLYVYTVIAIVAANIQVLKAVQFSFFHESVALGTVLFASTFLCTDILAEHYGVEKARKNVLIGFFGFLMMTVLMLFTIGFKPLDDGWSITIQESLSNIFIPLPTFFIASMIAYLVSQYFDVWFFKIIADLTNKRFLWLRNNLSTMTSSLIDNTIFSVLAWIVLNPNPLTFNEVLFKYIIGTYILRIFIALIDTPFLYLSKYLLPNKNND